MKKISLFLLGTFFLFSVSNAQEATILQSIKLLDNYAINHFKNIQGAEISKRMSNEDMVITYQSNLEVENSLSNIIVLKQSTKRNTAYFESILGRFNSLTEAETFLNGVINNFNKNNEGYTTKKVERYMSDYPTYVIIQITAISDKLFSNTTFEINKDSEHFFVSLFFGSDIPSKEYYYYAAEKNNDKIANDIRTIMLEAKNNFSKFKGNEMKNEKTTLGVFDKQFQSTVNIDGLNPCFIIERLSVLEFIIPYKMGVKDNQLKEEMAKTLQFMQSLLGSNYTYSFVSQGGRYDFVNPNDFDYFYRFIKLAEIQISEGPNSTFDIYILLKPYNKMVNF